MRIQLRVFLTILLSSAVLVAAIVLFMQWSISRGFVEYVNERQRADFMPMARELERRYAEDGWRALRDDPQLFHRITARYNPSRNRPDAMPRRPPPPRRDGENQRPPPPRGEPRPPAPPPVTLMDMDQRIVAGVTQPFEHSTHISLQVAGEQVGWLLLPRTERLTSGFDIKFQAQQRETFIVIGALVVALAGIFALLLAPGIVRPVRRIAEAAHKLSRKDYNVDLATNRRDELGELSRDMGELALTLHRSDQMQKRWLADTSHELRTPVSIIRGELEAMLDGVRPLNMENLQSIKQEVLQLQKLIEDLGDLSNADVGSLRYHKESLDLNELLEENISHYEWLCQQQGLAFRFEGASVPTMMYADAARVQQLIGNLIANSCKYSDSPGEVVLAIGRSNGHIVMTLDDTPPGVPDAALDQLFDYLYRVESSRNRKTGGAGLGLAIAARIVEAHEGEITAEASPLGGVRITVRLPRDLQG